MKIKKYITLILIFTFVITQLNSFSFASDYKSSDFTSYKYKQEITIPFDTSISQAKFQPIDIRIDFENECYGIDEYNHSIRVGCDIGSEILELESQIYDLEIENNKIDICSLVFLIPEEADGNEKYYVYYDSKETEKTSYKDHVKISETHYFYEPISGQVIDFDCYELFDGEELVYVVIQKGELLGNPISQNVAKLKPGSTFVETFTMDQLASFDLTVGIKEEPSYYGTSFATELTKQVLVDGNLMGRVRLICTSPDGTIFTDNIYTYYHQPSINKKLTVTCHQEILEDIEIEDPSYYDGSFAGIISIKTRSATIEKMNVGEILPELNVYTEQNIVESYDIPQNPTSLVKEGVLTTEADIDLGEKAWISLNKPSENKAHALIFDSIEDYYEGEKDGLQVKAWTKENLKLPGLEADTGNLYVMRNAYENGDHSTSFKKGFTADYNVELVHFENEGISLLNEEAKIFQKMINQVPIKKENTSTEKEEESEKYTLETTVHLSPSIPLGSLFSAASGKNISYILAEIYKDNSLKSEGAVARLSTGAISLDFEGKNIIQKIKTVIDLFDWKNASFFKKIVFPGLEKGRYVIKIYRENSIFSDDKIFIGFAVVDVDSDKKIRIFCSPEANTKISVFNQNGNGVKNADVFLLYDDSIISDGISDSNGTAFLNAPSKVGKKYSLKILYDGFLISEENLKLGILNHFILNKKSYDISLHDLEIDIIDSWGFTPEVDVNIKLKSSDMKEENNILAEQIDKKSYRFQNLLKASYLLNLKYKSFKLEKNINLDSDKKILLDFPAEYRVDLNIYDKLGQRIDSGIVKIKRNNKEISTKISKDKDVFFMVPPGTYDIKIQKDDKTIAFQDLIVKNDRSVEILSFQESFLHQIITYIIVAAIIGIVLFMLYFKKYKLGIKLIIVSILALSIFQPWWILNGEHAGTSTETVTMLYPPKILTYTDSTDGLGGSISIIPEELTDVLFVLSLLIAISIILVLISTFIKEKFRKIRILIGFFEIFLPIIILGIFYYAMSLVTEIGVGSFIGSGELSITIPGQMQDVLIDCSWGPGIAFYLVILSMILLIFSKLYKKTCVYKKFYSKQ